MCTVYWQMPAMLARQLGTPVTAFEIALLAPKVRSYKDHHERRGKISKRGPRLLRGAKTTHLRTFSASSRVIMRRSLGSSNGGRPYRYDDQINAD